MFISAVQMTTPIGKYVAGNRGSSWCLRHFPTKLLLHSRIFPFFFYVDFDGDHDLLEGPGLGYVDWVYGPGLDDKYRLDDPGFRDPARRDNPGLSEDGLPCLSLGKASNSLNPIGCPGQWWQINQRNKL
jgi:hypothetical protein